MNNKRHSKNNVGAVIEHNKDIASVCNNTNAENSENSRMLNTKRGTGSYNSNLSANK